MLTFFEKTSISHPLAHTKCQFFGKCCVRTKWMIPLKSFFHIVIASLLLTFDRYFPVGYFVGVFFGCHCLCYSLTRDFFVILKILLYFMLTFKVSSKSSFRYWFKQSFHQSLREISLNYYPRISFFKKN